jgi:hypothetical protein
VCPYSSCWPDDVNSPPGQDSYLSDMSYALISSSLRAFQLIRLLAP